MIGIVWAYRLYDDGNDPQRETETGPRSRQSHGGDITQDLSESSSESHHPATRQKRSAPKRIVRYVAVKKPKKVPGNKRRGRPPTHAVPSLLDQRGSGVVGDVVSVCPATDGHLGVSDGDHEHGPSDPDPLPDGPADGPTTATATADGH